MSQQTIFGIILFIYYCMMIFVLFKQVVNFKWSFVNICLLILNSAFIYIMTKQYWVLGKAFFDDIAKAQFFQSF